MRRIPRAAPLAALACAAALVVSPGAILASTCSWLPTLSRDFEAADRVFLGMITASERREARADLELAVSVRPLEVFKGDVARELHLAAGRPHGDDLLLEGLEERQTWLFFLSRENTWPGPCSGTARAADGSNAEPRVEAWLAQLRRAGADPADRLPEPWVAAQPTGGLCALSLSFVAPEGSGGSHFGNLAFLRDASGPRVGFRYHPPARAHLGPDPRVGLVVDDAAFSLEPVDDRGAFELNGSSDELLDSLLLAADSTVTVQPGGGEPIDVRYAGLREATERFEACGANLPPLD